MSHSVPIDQALHAFRQTVQSEYDVWKAAPPNLIQAGAGKLSRPLEIFLEPVASRIAPFLESGIRSLNGMIAGVVKERSAEGADVPIFEPQAFQTWVIEQDRTAKNWVTGGIAALTASGAGTGLGGFTMIAVDIPASFGLILAFANKIALTYQLDVTDPEIQSGIIRSIAAGSEASAEDKAVAVGTVRLVSRVLTKNAWKNLSATSMPGLVSVVQNTIQKLAGSLARRKAAQMIPVAGAVAGGLINGAWAADALESVRQFARMSVVDTYCASRGIFPEISTTGPALPVDPQRGS